MLREAAERRRVKQTQVSEHGWGCLPITTAAAKSTPHCCALLREGCVFPIRSADPVKLSSDYAGPLMNRAVVACVEGSEHIGRHMRLPLSTNDMQRAELNNFRKSHIAISRLTYTARLWLELQAPSLQRDWAAVAKEVDLPFDDPVQCDGPTTTKIASQTMLKSQVKPTSKASPASPPSLEKVGEDAEDHLAEEDRVSAYSKRTIVPDGIVDPCWSQRPSQNSSNSCYTLKSMTFGVRWLTEFRQFEYEAQLRGVDMLRARMQGAPQPRLVPQTNELRAHRLEWQTSRYPAGSDIR